MRTFILIVRIYSDAITIVPTAVINEKCGDNKSISLGRIKNLGFVAKTYSEIKAEIDMIIDNIQ